MSDPVEYFRIVEGEPLPDVSAYAPFRAVVVIDAAYSRDWQNQVSDWLVGSGCLYMMAWGEDCSSWDDSVDHANLDQFDYEEIPDEQFVMTTWHDNDTLDEVFWFAHFCADQGHVELGATLLIHISAANQRASMLARFVAARDLPCD